MPRIKGTEVAPGRFVPIVTVDFRCNGIGGPLPAVVDSGADKCLIPGQYVELAGVTFTSLPPLPEGTGAGGKFQKSLGAGTITYLGHLICEEFEVAPPGALPIILLGREEFFTKFRVNFLWHRDPPVFDIDPIT